MSLYQPITKLLVFRSLSENFYSKLTTRVPSSTSTSSDTFPLQDGSDPQKESGVTEEILGNALSIRDLINKLCDSLPPLPSTHLRDMCSLRYFDPFLVLPYMDISALHHIHSHFHIHIYPHPYPYLSISISISIHIHIHIYPHPYPPTSTYIHFLNISA